MPVERTGKTLRQTIPKSLFVLTSSATTSRKSTSSKNKSDAPGRVYTDTIPAIQPQFMDMIAKRDKNYEFRRYKLRDTVERLWLYETAPTSAITYVMETTRPKAPGGVNDASGVGNHDFDDGLKESQYAYPVLGLYKLKEPLKLSEMKKRFALTTPQGYCYAPKKLVEEMRLEDMIKVF